MSRWRKVSFEHQVAGIPLQVTARVKLPPRGSFHPGDPNNDSEVEVTDVAVRQAPGPIAVDIAEIDHLAVQQHGRWVPLGMVLNDRAFEVAQQ